MTNPIKVNRDVTPQECSWLMETVTAGTLVYQYIGVTYGCISEDGVAVALEGPDKPPFFQLPRDALDMNPEDPLYWVSRRKINVGRKRVYGPDHLGRGPVQAPAHFSTPSKPAAMKASDLEAAAELMDRYRKVMEWTESIDNIKEPSLWMRPAGLHGGINIMTQVPVQLIKDEIARQLQAVRDQLKALGLDPDA